jgi:hypothetical protein
VTHLNRDILLSSGAQCRLAGVAACLGILASSLEDSANARELVADLRKVCLGREIPDEQRDALWEAGLLMANNEAFNEEMKKVVLAAVRGEDRALYLVSPFVDKWDRVLSEALNAHNSIRCYLPRNEAAQLERALCDDPLQRVGDAFRNDRKRMASDSLGALRRKDSPPTGQEGPAR